MPLAVAVLDANVLVPVSLTDTLLRSAEHRRFVPLWSEAILDEVVRHVTRLHPVRGTEAARRRAALAGTGDRRGFAAAHQRASKRLQRTCPDERRHGMDFARATLDIAYYTGLAHLLLAEPAAAVSAFQTALGNLPETRVKARAVLLLSLALAAAEDRQLDHAAATAGEALALADHQPIGRIWQRVEDVRRAVDTASSPSATVRELDEHMVEFAGSLERVTSGPSS